MKRKFIAISLTVLLILQVIVPTFTYAQGTDESGTKDSQVSEVTKSTETTTASTTVSSQGSIAASSSVNNESSSLTKESSTDTTEPSISAAKEKAPAAATKTLRTAITDNIFTSAKLYKINGDEVQPSDTLPNMSGIKLNLKFSFANKNYQAGDTFATQLPQQIAIAKDLSGDFSPMTSANWKINAATKELTITFLEDNVAAEEYELTLTTSLEKVNGIDEETQKVVFDTTPTQTIFNLEMTSSVDTGKNTTAVAMDDLNPKSVQINSAFNLDRTNKDNRMFRVEAYNYTSKLSFDSIKVYTSDVDFNGALVGEKTLLTVDSDYKVSLKNAGTNQVAAEIQLTKPMNKKAVFVESIVTGVDGKNYVDESIAGAEYNYLYAYGYTYEDTTNISSSSASKSFVTLQPLEAKGTINKDTGNIDWEIKYNFNEQPLTTASQLTTNLADQGVEFVPGSLSVEKVGFTYNGGNDYEVNTQGDGTNELSVVSKTDGSLTLQPKANTTQAYIVRYSTKITDPTERVIKNKISNGTVNKEAQVSLIPNLLSKESGTIDVFNRTMEWTITINAEKYRMKNPVVHDYFIGAVKSYTDLTVKKKVSDTEFVPLTENVDYKLTGFDENGSPAGVQPNVNGAPDSFNGGVRIDFLGDYQQLDDTLVITIKTKLETSDQRTDIKNKATLNYGDTPGVIEYEAKGVFTDPYYTGGAKLGRASTMDDQYLYQDWLVLLNSKGTKFNMTKMADTLPAGTELVPGSLRFEEVTSESMLTNIQNYLRYDYNLVPEGDDAYPTKIDTENNQVNLEFAKLGEKRVYVKYKTRVKRDWYVYQRLDNKAEVTYDSQTPVDYQYTVYASNYDYALQKSAAKDPTKENVANWTLQTRNISSNMSVEDPVISDTLTQGTTNAAYDPTSFVVTDASTGEKISTDHYRLTFGDNSFKLTFSDYKAENNIKVTYNTISEFPGLVKNQSQVDSASYGGLNIYYRQSSANVNLNFTSGSGSGVVKTADLSVIKVDKEDESKVLEGATFEILTADGNETGLKADTNVDGKVTFTGLPLGEYLLKESKAPNGYEINAEYATGKLINLTENMEPIKVTNTKTVPNSVELVKTDQLTKDPLKNAVFQLQKADGTAADDNEYTTDIDGSIVITGLTKGDYQLVETQAPEGYQLDATPVKFTITERQGQVVNLKKTNTLSTGSVVLTKTNEQQDQMLKGAIFQLNSSDGTEMQSNLATDGNGKLTIKDLAPGDYQLVETQAPTGYELDATPVEFTITKAQAKAAEVQMINKAEPAKLGSAVLTKTDAKTGEALSGAVFELQDGQGKQLKSDLATDESGKLSLENLTAGDYQLVETQAPTGYEADQTPVKFTVTTEAKAIELVKTNKRIEGSVLLEKVDDVTGAALPGAEFTLKSTKGKTMVDKMTTDDNGRLAVKELPEGDYQFIETKAPDGYKLDAAPVTFTIKGKDEVQVKKTNKLLPNTVVLNKIDSQTSERLAKADFELQDDKGKTLQKNLTTNEAGTFVLEDLAPGKYQLVETQAPAGYVLDNTPVTFEVKDEKESLTLTKKNTKEETETKLPTTSGGSTQSTQSTQRLNRTYLPKTGSQNAPILLIIGALLIIVVGVVYVRRKRH
ncbi:MSCRAMM family protein [Enterococcus sp. AZ072]|uniref:MSCRAMM family protein n=1 Tax=unclassified Enterococcus TaxID=2608891 RepID=UPI003D2E1746